MGSMFLMDVIRVYSGYLFKYPLVVSKREIKRITDKTEIMKDPDKRDVKYFSFFLFLCDYLRGFFKKSPFDMVMVEVRLAC